MALRRAISLLISLLFLAIVLTTERCVNAQENNNELLKDALEMIYRRQNSIENNPQQDETVFLKSQTHNNYGGIPYLDVTEEQQRNDPIDFEQYRHIMDSSSGTPDDEITLPYEVFYNDNSSPTSDDIEQTPKPSKRKHSVFRERTNDGGEVIYPKYNEIPIQNNDNLENELDYMNLLQEYWQRYLAQRQQHHRVQQYEDVSPSKRNSHLRIPYNIHSDNIVMKKRFPVAKRSSNAPKKTDPKVERDLSNIFGGSGGSSSSTIKPVDESKKTKTPKKVSISNNNKKNQTKTKTDNLNIKKKSIDWSNYFGIDKRKKKSTPQNEWIIEQYKNTLKQINHMNDDTTHEQKQRRDDTKLDVIKDKLRNIEDMIIDEALKYTGAHEGADIDSKEIQEVKDKVMSRLAAVYSLEKMRRALGEFKKSIAEQRQQLKQSNQLNGDFDLLETDDTESSSDNHENDSTTLASSASSTSNEHVNRIPNKKDLLLHSNQNKDNNIMNQQSDEHIEDCDILEVIQRQCSHLATKAGEQLVQPLCMLHQLCTLCGIDDSNDSQQNVIENSDLGCYYMYAAESEHACAGETQCRRRANYALNTLRDVHTRSMFTSDMCPHNAVCVENVLETAKRRLSFSPYIMSRRNI